uniref:Uncharacterized protein MANES_09G097500 n=1 Tax=Rhizophora mucronata TaxID=61149 RepID=A0A2P2K191_RHIMU
MVTSPTMSHNKVEEISLELWLKTIILNFSLLLACSLSTTIPHFSLQIC